MAANGNLEEEITRIVRDEVRRALAENGGARTAAAAGEGGRGEGLRFPNLGANAEAKAFLLGVAAALALAALWPTLKPAVKSSLKGAIQGLSELSEQVKSVLGETKEALADIVAEAQFEKMKAELEPEAGE